MPCKEICLVMLFGTYYKIPLNVNISGVWIYFSKLFYLAFHQTCFSVFKFRTNWNAFALLQLQDGLCEPEKEFCKKYSYYDYPIEGKV